MNPVNRLFTLQSDREALPAIEEPKLPRRIRLANAAAGSLNEAGKVIVNDIAPVVSGVFSGTMDSVNQEHPNNGRFKRVIKNGAAVLMLAGASKYIIHDENGNPSDKMPNPFVTQKHTLTEEIGFSVLRASNIIDDISDGMLDKIAARADKKSPKS